MRDGERVQVAYDVSELGEAISADAIPAGRVRGVFHHQGRLWAITGAAHLRGQPTEYDACEVLPEAHYRGERTTYNQRSQGLMALDRGPCGKWACKCEACVSARAAASKRRAAFYEGMPVSHKGIAYRFTDRRATWVSIASFVQQQDLFA